LEKWDSLRFAPCPANKGGAATLHSAQSVFCDVHAAKTLVLARFWVLFPRGKSAPPEAGHARNPHTDFHAKKTALPHTEQAQ